MLYKNQQKLTLDTMANMSVPVWVLTAPCTLKTSFVNFVLMQPPVTAQLCY